MEIIAKSHDRLQSDCFQWHYNEYPDDRHLVHANISNSVGGRYGNHNKAIGVLKGRCDLQYFKRNTLYLFEFKVGDDSQKPEQRKFQQVNEAEGAIYYLISFEDEYKRIIMDIRKKVGSTP